MLLENCSYPADVRVRLEAESLTAAGYHVTVIAPRAPGQPRHDSVNGVTVERFRLPESRGSVAGIVREYLLANLQLYPRGVLALIRGAEILHLHNPPDTFFAAAYVARALGRRVVYDFHDTSPELFATKFGDGPIAGCLRWLERRSARSADHVLTVNQSLLELASARDGVSIDRITVVRNAPPEAMLGQARPARDGVLTDPRLVFAGTIESQDGVDLLPELVRLLRDERGLTGVTMTVVGDGSVRRDVEAGCRRAGVHGNVTFTGRVPHSQIAGLLAAADICVEPAPCNAFNHRCSMVKIYEYMAAGRPIIGYPLREVQRLAGRDMLYAQCGDIEELADLAVRLAGNPALRSRLGSQLLKRAQQLTWERSSEALLAAYRSLPAGSEDVPFTGRKPRAEGP